jgi:hypothetical protein
MAKRTTPKRTAFDDFKDAANSLIGRLYQDKEMEESYVFTGVGRGFWDGTYHEDHLWFHNLTLDSTISVPSMAGVNRMTPISNYRKGLIHDEAEVLAYWELEQARTKEFQKAEENRQFQKITQEVVAYMKRYPYPIATKEGQMVHSRLVEAMDYLRLHPITPKEVQTTKV